MSNSSLCPVCSLEAEPSFSIIAGTCKHAFHVDCAGPNIDYEYCPSCSNVSSSGGITKLTSFIVEPHTTDGIDYVFNPGTRTQESVFKNGIASVVSLVTRKGLDKKVESPLELLRKRIPIKTIMTKHGYGLDHMLKDGVLIDDFVSNGYKWEDISAFEYISKDGPTRSKQTFTNGLGLTATHLKVYPQQLPIDKFRELTDISNGEFNTLLGLYFKEDGPLCCDGVDYAWTAKDCAKLGLTMSDLISFGMVWMEQYQDLMTGLTEREIAKAEKDLKVTPYQIQGLRSIVEERTKLLPTQPPKVVATTALPIECHEDEPPYDDVDEDLQQAHDEAFLREQEIQKPVSRRAAAAAAAPKKIEELVIPQRKKNNAPVVVAAAVTNYEPSVHVPASFRRKQATGGKKTSLIIYK
jgi:hypothetical protein